MDFAQVSKIRLEGKPYDAEVEYIESTGTQYIDTGITPDANTVWYTKLAFTNLSNDNGCGTAIRTGGMGFRQRASNTTLYTRGYYHNYDTTVNPGTNTFTIMIDASHAGVNVNGSWKRTQDAHAWTNDGNSQQIRLFGLYETLGTPRVLPGEMRIYACKISVGGATVRDFIPVRKNGIGYLFDKVSDQLFGNHGTGAFLYGSDVRCYSVAKIERGSTTLWKKRPYDAEVEYLESTGTQYIDTGFKPKVGDEIFMRAYTWPNKASPFFACRGLNRSAAWGINRNNGGGWCGYWRSDYQPSSGIQGMYQNTTEGWTVVRQSSSSYDLFRTNQSYSQGSSANADALVPLYIFACNDNGAVPSPGTPYLTGGMRCAYFYVVRGGVRVIDFIPVRVGSGANAVGCLYDKLCTGGMNPDGSARNDGLYFRQGSGAFVVGPDKGTGLSMSPFLYLEETDLNPSDQDATESETQEEPQED